MITVGFAKKKGVVFVTGDLIGGRDIEHAGAERANNTDKIDLMEVTSFTDRKHIGDEMPCGGGLPVIISMRAGHVQNGNNACKCRWSIEGLAGDITSWKLDLEALKNLANKKEEKHMGEKKQYTYELVKGLTPIQVINKVMNGDKSYFAYISESLASHLTKTSSLEDFVNIHQRKEIEMVTRTITYPKPVSEPLSVGDEYWVIDGVQVYRTIWNNDSIYSDWLSKGRIHLTKENAQAHWDGLFGGK